MSAALAACSDCATARARCRETGDTYVCTCGRRYRARMLVYRADPDGATPQRAPLDRAGHAAVRADDPDLARVRRVLAELRPDVVTEGGDAAGVLSHAAVTHGGRYFVVPRVVDECSVTRDA